MAAFKTHITAGIIIGYIAGAFAAVVQWITAPFTPVCMLAAAFIGSFLPDLDSDHGKPFRIIFSFISVTVASLVFVYFLKQNTIHWNRWIAIPPLVALIIRYGIGKIFQKYTVHRGIFHSIPAMLIIIFATPMALASFQLAANDIIAIALSTGAGFFSHLVLDEIYSVVDFEGMKIKPKNSLGTAFTFIGYSKAGTAAAYLLLAALIFYNRRLLAQIFPVFRF